MEGSEIVQKSEYQCRDCECWVSNANTRCGECESKRHADNHQRRRYAEAALMGIVSGITTFRDDAADIIVNRPRDAAEIAWVYADCMLAEQKRRESAESAS